MVMNHLQQLAGVCAVLLNLNRFAAYTVVPQDETHSTSYDIRIEVKMRELATVLRVNSA
jgi:hypothetical protein